MPNGNAALASGGGPKDQILITENTSSPRGIKAAFRLEGTLNTDANTYTFPYASHYGIHISSSYDVNAVVGNGGRG